ncbi:DUF4292 domain-containing protein [Empedobacter stercoris]|uniref:DUF4292 domain-containing protein n=1 Tax=Empedobacter stercoris TaxID=1628248 RepID=UPI0016628545|nr:DUF4292 domain-containing protein [Empedobacter stercoris]MCA4776040.1 DUF4292 domain-containing protein [Empedobacter stercoris]MCA4809141.1 DUF4292 domain-containing protein [Empedobacter stercoris]QNT15152.1 DUF4292 domain-containing protein [Empedobacter stercoris]
MIKKLTYIFCLGILATACNTQKVAKVEKDNKTEVVSASAKIIQQTLSKKSSFKDVIVRGKASTDLGNVNATISIKNGQKISVNLSKLGYVGASALITPEGFAAYEKLGKTYYEGDFSIANKLLNVDFIDYQKLQNLMLGKVFVDLNPTDYTASFANNQYTITYNKNQAIVASPTEGEYIQTYIFDNGFRLIEAHLKDPKRKMEVDLTYNNWVKAGAEEFPKNVKIIIKDKKTRQVELEYNSFTFQETNTPFSIPDGYKKKDIK